MLIPIVYVDGIESHTSKTDTLHTTFGTRNTRRLISDGTQIHGHKIIENAPGLQAIVQIVYSNVPNPYSVWARPTSQA